MPKLCPYSGSMARADVSFADVSFIPHPAATSVLTPAAVEFLADLHRSFERRRKDLLAARAERQERFDGGQRPDFLERTAPIRRSEWWLPEAPKALADRRVEIVCAAGRSSMIEALHSGARVCVADLEDATSPTWDNVVTAQVNLADAARGSLVGETAAALVVRPRGLHLEERHFRVDGEPISAALFDFGLYVFHNARESLSRGAGPYLSLPKLEGHLEARLWADVFFHAEDAVDVDPASIRATVAIETVTAAFEMDEILYELRHHACALSAGRRDYLFSLAKRFHGDPAFVLADGGVATATTSPYLRAYTDLLVKTAHRRCAHAIGPVAATADDNHRQADDGFDGTAVAHPDLVAEAEAAFDAVLDDRLNQLGRQRDEVHVGHARLLEVDCPPGAVTSAGLAASVSMAARYLVAWLSGAATVTIDGASIDTAAAEIARTQVWQCLHHGVTLADGEKVTARRVASLLEATAAAVIDAGADPGVVAEAKEVFAAVAMGETFLPFLTVPAYELLP